MTDLPVPFPLFAPDPRLKRRKPTYPTAYMFGLPPDPRRKSRNLMVIGRAGPQGPLTIACCNGCSEKGRAQPDGSCRHTQAVMAHLRPWWRSRAHPKQAGATRPTPSAQGGERRSEGGA